MKKLFIFLVVFAVHYRWRDVLFCSRTWNANCRRCDRKARQRSYGQTSVGVSGVGHIDQRGSAERLTGSALAARRATRHARTFSLSNITVDIDPGQCPRGAHCYRESTHRSPRVVFAEVKKGRFRRTSPTCRKRSRSYAGTKNAGGNGSGDSGGEEKRIRIKSFVFEKGPHRGGTRPNSALIRPSSTFPRFALRMSAVTTAVRPMSSPKTILTAVAKQVASEVAKSEASRQLQNTAKEKAGDLLKKLTD